MATNSFDLNLKNKVVSTLQNLAPKLEKKYLNHAVRQGANIVKKYARQAAKRFDDPKTSESVWKEIVASTNTQLGKENDGVAISVGVKGGARKYTNNKGNRASRRVGKIYQGPGNVYYWRFLEFGTSKMKAQPFMRPALAEHVDEVSGAITTDLNKSIDKIVAGSG